MNRPPRVFLPRAPVFALVGLLGCASDPPLLDGGRMDVGPIVDADPLTLDDPTLDLGTGQLDWEPLSRATPTAVELIHGPQGGYHLFGRVRSGRLRPEVQVSFVVTDLVTGRVLNNPDDRMTLREGRGLVREGGGWATSGPLLVILERIAGPTEVVGRRVSVEVRVRPLDDIRSARTARVVRVVDKT